MTRPCGDGNVLCLDCMAVNVLTVILDCSFTRRYYWGKQDKGYTVFLCITSYNCMLIYNYFEIKSLVKKIKNLKSYWPFSSRIMEAHSNAVRVNNRQPFSWISAILCWIRNPLKVRDYAFNGKIWCVSNYWLIFVFFNFQLQIAL